jgi:hypothetical protein
MTNITSITNFGVKLKARTKALAATLDAWCSGRVPRWEIIRQIVQEFWVATAGAAMVAIFKATFFGGVLFPSFTAAFIFFYFYTAAFVRISRQQKQDATLGTVVKKIDEVNSGVSTLTTEVVKLIEKAQSGSSLDDAGYEALKQVANATIKVSGDLAQANTAINELSFRSGDTEHIVSIVSPSPEQEKKLRELLGGRPFSSLFKKPE